jgi:quinol monooxygenase YgiN
MMVSFTVRLDFDASDREKVEDYLRKLTAATRQEPGCVTYVAHFIQEGPPAILIYEQYRDEAAVEQHRGSPHFASYAADGLFKLTGNRRLERLDAIA